MAPLSTRLWRATTHMLKSSKKKRCSATHGSLNICLIRVFFCAYRCWTNNNSWKPRLEGRRVNITLSHTQRTAYFYKIYFFNICVFNKLIFFFVIFDFILYFLKDLFLILIIQEGQNIGQVLKDLFDVLLALLMSIINYIFLLTLLRLD